MLGCVIYSLYRRSGQIKSAEIKKNTHQDHKVKVKEKDVRMKIIRSKVESSVSGMVLVENIAIMILICIV